MDKISSILPTNARITTVDLKSSGTARAGMPNYGREVATSHTNERRVAMEAAQRAKEHFKNQMDGRQRAADPKAQIVTQMTERFFSNRANEIKMAEETAPSLNSPEEVNIEPVIAAIRGDQSSNAGKTEAKENQVPVSETEEAARAANSPANASANEEASTDEGEEDMDAVATGQYLDVRA